MKTSVVTIKSTTIQTLSATIQTLEISIHMVIAKMALLCSILEMFSTHTTNGRTIIGT